MDPPPSSPAPAPGASARQPPPPQLESARLEGEKLGRLYGAFEAKVQLFDDLFGKKWGGVTVWDRTPDADKKSILGRLVQDIAALPKLPAMSSRPEAMALREGFFSGASRAYITARVEYWAVKIASELAIDLVLAAATMGAAPVVRTISAASAETFADCAARTASRVFLEAAGADVPAASIFRSFGLPRSSISSMKDAISYAKNYFTKLGITLRPNPVALEAGVSASRYPAGRYVIFMEGADGHVVYGEIAGDSMTVIDDQIGKRWTSLMEAQNALRMRVSVAYLVDSVVPPL